MLMFRPLQRYAEFEGRSRRSEYWLFLLFAWIAVVVADTAERLAFGEEAGVLTGVLVLALFVPMLAVTVRRLHDSNRSGWWILINLIPVLGGLVLFIFMLLDGAVGDNRFGPDPKGRVAGGSVEAAA